MYLFFFLLYAITALTGLLVGRYTSVHSWVIVLPSKWLVIILQLDLFSNNVFSFTDIFWLRYAQTSASFPKPLVERQGRLVRHKPPFKQRLPPFFKVSSVWCRTLPLEKSKKTENAVLERIKIQRNTIPWKTAATAADLSNRYSLSIRVADSANPLDCPCILHKMFSFCLQFV